VSLFQTHNILITPAITISPRPWRGLCCINSLRHKP
jgi:hypothetical protein